MPPLAVSAPPPPAENREPRPPLIGCSVLVDGRIAQTKLCVPRPRAPARDCSSGGRKPDNLGTRQSGTPPPAPPRPARAPPAGGRNPACLILISPLSCPTGAESLPLPTGRPRRARASAGGGRPGRGFRRRSAPPASPPGPKRPQGRRGTRRLGQHLADTTEILQETLQNRPESPASRRAPAGLMRAAAGAPSRGGTRRAVQPPPPPDELSPRPPPPPRVGPLLAEGTESCAARGRSTARHAAGGAPRGQRRGGALGGERRGPLRGVAAHQRPRRRPRRAVHHRRGGGGSARA